MRLRKQLLLLSLVTLALPWAGCQYLREFQHTIERGQALALSATAKAISARIQSDPITLGELKARNIDKDSGSLFAHRLKTSPIIDGYDEEWLAESVKPMNLQYRNPIKTASNESFSAKMITGLFNNKINIFIYVEDKEILYFNPIGSNKSLTDTVSLEKVDDTYDNITLYVKKPDTENELQIYKISAFGPGNIRAQTTDQNGYRVEHQIKGKWLENTTGYQLELEMPKAWANDGLLLEVINAETNATLSITDKPFTSSLDLKTSTISSATPENKSHVTLPPIITQSAILDKALNIFLRDDLSLYITDLKKNAIGLSKSTKNIQNHTLPWFVQVIYQYILENSNEDKSITDNTTIIKNGTRKTIIAKESIVLDGDTLGFVHVEQNLNSLSSETNTAFSRLILYSIVATLTVALVLIFYASWLSLRIRSLSRAAKKAVSDKGTISAEFPVFTIKDEVAELSESYSELLERLREYTRYLQTLSSKLSHELRTPLAIVTSSLDNLSMSKLDAEANTYAQRANSGAKRLSSLLNAMSSASRIEQAIESAEVSQFDLMHILPDLSEAYRSAYPNINIVLELPEQKKSMLMVGVPELIVQLLDKLIDNASGFSPREGEVRLKAVEKSGSIFLSMQNQGPLLPENMSTQLFDSLVSIRDQDAQTNAHTKNQRESASHLGLGLFIVRLIAEFHQGSVSANNLNDDSGVIFTVELPGQTRGNKHE